VTTSQEHGHLVFAEEKLEQENRELIEWVLFVPREVEIK